VVSHHGHGRPSVATAISAGLPCSVTIGGVAFTAVADPGRVDHAQPERFRALCERYGYWGLALLETIVRQADHLVSAVTEVV
jgi:CRISPR-associated endonuclease/helicase Cas3